MSDCGDWSALVTRLYSFKVETQCPFRNDQIPTKFRPLCDKSPLVASDTCDRQHSSKPRIMLHPLYVLPNRFFYAIGNTPAVSLLSHQPPGKTPAECLLLGCGDPRNVLYTVFCNENGTETRILSELIFSTDGLKAKNLSFVCCDNEPAILGNNNSSCK